MSEADEGNLWCKNRLGIFSDGIVGEGEGAGDGDGDGDGDGEGEGDGGGEGDGEGEGEAIWGRGIWAFARSGKLRAPAGSLYSSQAELGE